jgi:hypothetical protein
MKEEKTMKEIGCLEHRRIKKMLGLIREHSLVLAVLFVMVSTMFIGMCAFAKNTHQELQELKHCIMDMQCDVNRIKWEVIE